MSPPRRKPHCHTCGKPMAGHRRREGTLLCPEESLPSPPPSPTPSSRSLSAGSFRSATIPDIDIPDDLPFHRPNPYWVDPAPISQSSSFDVFEHEGSVVSTVLADDAASIKTFDDDETTDDENGSVIDSALNTSLPLASIFSTPKEDIANIRKAADATGLYMGLMRRPGAREDGKSTFDKFGKREQSWWVVMGKSAEAVKYLANTQQLKDMPGLYVPEKELYESRVPVTPAVGFLQVVLAGIIGGAAVTFGMARWL